MSIETVIVLAIVAVVFLVCAIVRSITKAMIEDAKEETRREVLLETEEKTRKSEEKKITVVLKDGHIFETTVQWADYYNTGDAYLVHDGNGNKIAEFPHDVVNGIYVGEFQWS